MEAALERQQVPRAGSRPHERLFWWQLDCDSRELGGVANPS